MEKKNICIIIPGFIKSYNHLYYLKKIFSKLDANIYFFGYIFDYMIHPCAYRNNISYDHDKNEKLCKYKLKSFFTDFDFIDNNTYNIYNSKNYDNRIFSQWNNIYKSFELYLKFQERTKIKCNFFIKLRSDYYFQNFDLFTNHIYNTYYSNKLFLYFYNEKNQIYSDHIFMGNFDNFQIISNLSLHYDYYFTILESKYQYKKSVSNILFEEQSEYLLTEYIGDKIKKENIIISSKNIGKIVRK